MPLVESNRDEFRSLLINPDVIRWCFDLPSEGEVSRKFAEKSRDDMTSLQIPLWLKRDSSLLKSV